MPRGRGRPTKSYAGVNLSAQGGGQTTRYLEECVHHALCVETLTEPNSSKAPQEVSYDVAQEGFFRCC